MPLNQTRNPGQFLQAKLRSYSVGTRTVLIPLVDPGMLQTTCYTSWPLLSFTGGAELLLLKEGRSHQDPDPGMSKRLVKAPTQFYRKCGATSLGQDSFSSPQYVNPRMLRTCCYNLWPRLSFSCGCGATALGHESLSSPQHPDPGISFRLLAI